MCSKRQSFIFNILKVGIMAHVNLKKFSCFSVLIGLSLSLSFFPSCKISQKILSEQESRIGDMTFPMQRNFNNSELLIGRRICASLKKKREFFQTLYDRQEQFRFLSTTIDCEGRSTESNFDAAISNSFGLEYSSITAQANYFRDVVTDRSGIMNDLCGSISTSDNVSNTIRTGSMKYTINFLIAENFDRFDIKKELSDNNGGFTVAGGESISVFTLPGQVNSKFLGVEKERTRMTSCDGKKFQTMKQSWKQALTNF
jgi:hypothetical protein